jgi:hypothetical protein
MWIFTIDGFFSVVEHKDQPAFSMMIKARNRAHLEAVASWLEEHEDYRAHIVENDQWDFVVRMSVPKESWVNYLAARTMEINYSGNVKGNIMENTDPELGNAMFDIWETMLDYQREIHPGSAWTLG